MKREEVRSFPLVRLDVPDKWEKFQATGQDTPCWRMVLRGADTERGASWEGRQYLYALGFGDAKPTYGRLRVMNAEHEEGYTFQYRRRVDGTFNDIGSRVVDAEITFDNRHSGYLVLEAIHTPVTVEALGGAPWLVYVSQWNKVTLKGLGAQIREKVDLSNALWVGSELSRTARATGRFSTRAWFAVVPAGKPVTVHHESDTGKIVDKQFGGRASVSDLIAGTAVVEGGFNHQHYQCYQPMDQRYSERDARYPAQGEVSAPLVPPLCNPAPPAWKEIRDYLDPEYVAEVEAAGPPDTDDFISLQQS